MRKSRVRVAERPAIGEQKIRVADWEGDAAIGKENKNGLAAPDGPCITQCAGAPPKLVVTRSSSTTANDPTTDREKYWDFVRRMRYSLQ